MYKLNSMKKKSYVLPKMMWRKWKGKPQIWRNHTQYIHQTKDLLPETSYNSVNIRKMDHFFKCQNCAHNLQIIDHKGNRNESWKEIPIHTHTRMAKIIRLSVSSFGKDMEQLELSNVTGKTETVLRYGNQCGYIM